MVGIQQNEDNTQIPVISRIHNAYSSIESVKESSIYVKDDLKSEYYEQLNEIYEKRRMLENTLDDLKESRASSYDLVIAKIEEKLNELDILLRRVKDRYQR